MPPFPKRTKRASDRMPSNDVLEIVNAVHFQNTARQFALDFLAHVSEHCSNQVLVNTFAGNDMDNMLFVEPTLDEDKSYIYHGEHVVPLANATELIKYFDTHPGVYESYMAKMGQNCNQLAFECNTPDDGIVLV